MRTTLIALLACTALTTATAQTVNTCKVNGKTMLTDKPCDRAMEATMEFGTPTDRARKQLHESQQASNCATLTSAKTSLTNTLQQPQSFAFKDMIEQQMKSINEQMHKQGC